MSAQGEGCRTSEEPTAHQDKAQQAGVFFFTRTTQTEWLTSREHQGQWYSESSLIFEKDGAIPTAYVVNSTS
jgi:hypothetical protein